MAKTKEVDHYYAPQKNSTGYSLIEVLEVCERTRPFDWGTKTDTETKRTETRPQRARRGEIIMCTLVLGQSRGVSASVYSRHYNLQQTRARARLMFNARACERSRTQNYIIRQKRRGNTNL